MNKLFVAYGSNLNIEQMEYRCPGSFVSGPGLLWNHHLTFRGSRAGVANIEWRRGFSVPVLLWSVPPRDEEALDQYEGFPWLYGKQRVHVTLPSSREIMAWAYIMQPGLPVMPPSADYFRTILEGYHTAGFEPQALWEAAEACGPLPRVLREHRSLLLQKG